MQAGAQAHRLSHPPPKVEKKTPLLSTVIRILSRRVTVRAAVIQPGKLSSRSDLALSRQTDHCRRLSTVHALSGAADENGHAGWMRVRGDGCQSACFDWMIAERAANGGERAERGGGGGGLRQIVSESVS